MDKLWLVVAFAFTCIGVWYIVDELWRVHRARVWPAVKGRVLGSQVDIQEGESAGAVYCVSVQYQYSVLGSPYTVSKSIIGPATDVKSARVKGQELRDSYPVGLDLPIAYNPKQPEQSEIADNTQRRINYDKLLVGFIWIFSWVFIILQAAREEP